MSDSLNFRKAAVLGAGVMGAQIAAHLVSAGVETYLFDLPGHDHDPNSIAKGAINALLKLKPSPLSDAQDTQWIIPANYETDLAQLKECDFVIEAISERFEWKQELYEKITPYLKDEVVFATNTSGLSITELAKTLPENLQPRFLGVHFFNPPRYMKLVECIPHSNTSLKLMEKLEEFLVVRLGKGVIYAKDTPNFIGNRVGVFSMLSVLHHAEQFGLTPDVVDALTGPVIGRPKSATFRTMDIVGLDTMRHVVATMQDSLKEDPWASFFKLPQWFDELVNKGALGQKSGKGIYKKEGNKILVFDVKENHYRPSHPKAHPGVLDILKKPLDEQMSALKAYDHPQAQFLWACFRDCFHYCAYHLNTIAQNTRDVDLAMRWGYGWATGPFETWQQAGFEKVKQLIEQDIKDQKTMASVALPDWLNSLKQEAFFNQTGAYSPHADHFEPRSGLTFYQRQLARERFPGEQELQGQIIFENDGLICWTLEGQHAIVSFKTKKNSISQTVLEGMLEAIERAEHEYDSLILWQKNGSDFSVGANLKEILEAIKSKNYNQIDQMIQCFHNVASRLKYASIPTISAISGLCLGGGNEFALHTTKRVVALESYIGLPEVAIGVIPAGGGCKELALRAYQAANSAFDLKPLETIFQCVAKAQVSTSAKEAQKLGYLKPSDRIVMNSQEVLFEALKEANALSGPNYAAQLPAKIAVAGKTAFANFQAMLVNMREGHFISDHDYLVGTLLAEVFAGGQVDEGSLVGEQWLFDLEKAAFMQLIETELTAKRIEHTLTTGKPLRN